MPLFMHPLHPPEPLESCQVLLVCAGVHADVPCGWRHCAHAQEGRAARRQVPHPQKHHCLPAGKPPCLLSLPPLPALAEVRQLTNCNLLDVPIHLLPI